MYGGCSYAMVDKQYCADVQATARAGTLQPIDYTSQHPSYATAAGGAISTADNMARIRTDPIGNSPSDTTEICLGVALGPRGLGQRNR